MEALEGFITGLIIALRPENLLYCFIGSVIGTAVGVLPGIGPIAGIAILLPLTFQLDATGAIIMLTAIYYGAMYGGTITTVLMKVPGEGSSAVIAVDAHEMAKQGRAGVALALAAIGSFIGGIFATGVLIFAGPPLAGVALEFGPPEFFGLMLIGLSLLIGFSGGSPIAGIISALLGLAISLPGSDIVTGGPRLTFGTLDLLDGISFIPVIMGLYGIGEILYNLENRLSDTSISKVDSTRVTRDDLCKSAAPIARGTGIGVFLGLIPGIGTILPTIVSYAVEKRVSRHPETFGRGALEGVVGPETTNNAYANAALIPLFTLGIPASPTIAVLLGAFMMNGLTPGPFLFEDNPEFVWTVIASFCVGNLMLLILNLPLVRIWVRLLQIPYSILFPLILAFTVVGSYVTSHNQFDVYILLGFGVVGYAFKKIGFPIAPIAFTLILGPLTEKALRQSLSMSGGDPSVLFRGWLSTILIVVAVIAIVLPIVMQVLRRMGKLPESTILPVADED